MYICRAVHSENPFTDRFATQIIVTSAQTLMIRERRKKNKKRIGGWILNYNKFVKNEKNFLQLIIIFPLQLCMYVHTMILSILYVCRGVGDKYLIL